MPNCDNEADLVDRLIDHAKATTDKAARALLCLAAIEISRISRGGGPGLVNRLRDHAEATTDKAAQCLLVAAAVQLSRREQPPAPSAWVTAACSIAGASLGLLAIALGGWVPTLCLVLLVAAAAWCGRLLALVQIAGVVAACCLPSLFFLIAPPEAAELALPVAFCSGVVCGQLVGHGGAFS